VRSGAWAVILAHEQRVSVVQVMEAASSADQVPWTPWSGTGLPGRCTPREWWQKRGWI